MAVFTFLVSLLTAWNGGAPASPAKSCPASVSALATGCPKKPSGYARIPTNTGAQPANRFVPHPLGH